MINLKQLLSENMVRFGTKNLSEIQQSSLLNEAVVPYSPPQMNDTNAPNRLKFKSKADYESWRAPISLSIPETAEAFAACTPFVFDQEKGKAGKFVKDYSYSNDRTQTCDRYLTFIYADMIEACAIAGARYIGWVSPENSLPKLYNANYSAFENRDTLKLYLDLRSNVQAGSYTSGTGKSTIYNMLFRPKIWKYIAKNVLTPALQKRCADYCVPPAPAGNKP